MKISFFSSGLAYYLGGPAFSEGSLISELQKQHDVTVFLSKGRFEQKLLQDYGIKNVVEFENHHFAELYLPAHSFMKKELTSSDVVHLNGHWKWWYKPVSDFCIHKGIPYVLHPRGMLLVGHRKKYIKRLFNLCIGNSIVNRASAVIALSEYEKEQFAPYHILANRVPVIPNGIPIPQLVPDSAPQLPKGVKSYFLYIGRIESRKNLIFLINAFKVYAKSHSASLLIVGPAEHGYDLELKEHIRTLALSDRVFILDGVYAEEKNRLIANSCAVIYPSNDEPFGRVPFEAIACNVFPIVPDKSGANEYLRPFLPDGIYRHQDEDSLVTAMVHAEKNPELWKPAVVKAKGWMQSALDWKNISNQVISMYLSLPSHARATSLSRQIR